GQEDVVEPFVFLYAAGEVQDATGPRVVVGGREGGAAAKQVVGDDDPARGELGQHEVEVARVVGLPGVDPHEVEGPGQGRERLAGVALDQLDPVGQRAGGD